MRKKTWAMVFGGEGGFGEESVADEGRKVFTVVVPSDYWGKGRKPIVPETVSPNS